MILMRGSLGLSLLVALTAGTVGCRSFGTDSFGLSNRKRMSPESSATMASRAKPKSAVPDRDPADAGPGRRWPRVPSQSGEIVIAPADGAPFL